MTKITIIGASSGIGLKSLELALDRDHYVTAFSRSAKSIGIEHKNLEKINGNALDKNDLEKVISGSDIVIQSLGVPLNFNLLTGPISLFSESTVKIIEIMKESNVKRLISVTGFGAGDSISSIHPLQKIGFNLVFGRAYNDKTIQEELIKNSSLAWTIVRPGVLTNCNKEREYKVLDKPEDWRNGVISRHSVADFIIKQIDDKSYINKAPVLIN